MKRKILVPVFASAMALSINTVANADNTADKTLENKDTKDNSLQLDDFKEASFKKAVVKDGVAVKIRQEGAVQTVAYSSDEFKVLGTQGEWVKIQLNDGTEGWMAARYVDIKEADGFVTANKVNFRSDSNTDAKVIEELEVGAKVAVVEDQKDWVKVKNGDKEGYVHKLYISDEAPVIEEPEVVIDENTTTNTTSNENNDSSNTESNNSSSNDSSSNSSSSSDSNSNSNNSSSSDSNNSSSNSNSDSNNGSSNNESSDNNSSSNNGSSNNESSDNNSSSNNGSSNNESNDNNSSNNNNSNNNESSEEESNNVPDSSSAKVQAVLNLAASKIGSPYVWGAEGPNSFDCSGFTSYVMRNAAGISIPRTSSAQAGYGTTVSKSNLQPGDLVFFNTSGSGVSHVGIYVGGGQMLHAPSSGKTVSYANINSSYYASRFVTAKRVL